MRKSSGSGFGEKNGGEKVKEEETEVSGDISLGSCRETKQWNENFAINGKISGNEDKLGNGFL